MFIWSSEIKELEKLYDSFKGQLPELEKELEQLVISADPIVVFLYSRRSLEVIVTDLCEFELKRPRKTQPLKGIIDLLNSENKLPEHIITSMLNLNSLSTYGAHPKDFDPRQVRTALINLSTIIDWYLAYKGFGKKEIPDIRPKKSEIATIETKIPKQKSIIVLPFVNMSPDPNQEYFSDGLTEEIITDLSHIHDLLVISRSSAMTFKGTRNTISEISKKVNVQYVLEGSVRKSGNNLKITAQLINAENDSHIWAEKYSGTMDDIFDIQEKVSCAIVEELKAKLTKYENEIIFKKPITDLRAYDLYLRYRKELWKCTENSLLIALDCLQKIIDIVGENDFIYSCIANVYFQFYNNGIRMDEHTLMQTEEYTKKVLTINPDSSSALCLLGQLRLFKGTILEASKYFLKAFTIDPNNPDSLLWMIACYGLYFGKPKLVGNYASKILEIDPLIPISQWVPGIIYWSEGKFDLALEASFKYLEAEPDGLMAKWYYAQMLAWNNQLDNAYIVMDQLITRASGQIFGSTISFLKFALQGEKEKALKSMSDNELKNAWNDFHLPWFISECYSLINEKDESLKWLEHSIEKGFINFPIISKLDPFLCNIRGEDQFKRLVDKVKNLWDTFETSDIN